MDYTAPTARVEDGLYLPENPSLPTRLRVAVRALRVLEKKPDDAVAAPVFNASIDGDIFRRHVEALGQTDFGRTLLSDKPSLDAKRVDLEALRQLPDGTVGREFARYFEVNKIQPFETPYEVRNDTDYLVKWYRETHDLHHVLTGYATDALGEMELQAFVAGNLGLRTSLFILSFAAILMPHGLPPIWRYAHRLRAAYRRGKRTKNLFHLRYERCMERTLESVREELHLPPLAEA